MHVGNEGYLPVKSCIFIGLTTGINITARPNKMVAGLDVVKTNELLQAIGNALEKKV